ncbi:hypothetical protein BVC80_8985g53 [Macleaya cordata]|uniref:AB hydrolase-1 domain-containing protein n=1 Tax=Macleaya cordata TaxID=56857 RepID=A0A200QJ52_MACCD|nr:hypothetical protein BVC80_8985g53 [Macleaya cordata]
MEMKEGKKHFVLAHGACHGSWCWYKLATLLKSAGHRVTALDLAASGINPKQVNDLRSFSDYFEPLMNFMEHSLPAKERVILVGHSMGGMGISKAMESFPEKISFAVFLTALMPGPTLDLSALFQVGSRGDSIYTYDGEGLENQPTTFIFGPKYISSYMYQLCSPEDLSLATMLLRPIRLYSEENPQNQIVLSQEKYGSVRRVYIMCDQDKALPEDVQRLMIQNDPTIDVKVITGSDHMVMLSKPQELSACLQEIAEA